GGNEMNQKAYELREKRLVEYLGAKVVANFVIATRKEIERHQLDVLPSDILQALLQHVGEIVELQRPYDHEESSL
ncbi:hypothetical protein CN585_29845, partial [Bacillus toyonensis]